MADIKREYFDLVLNKIDENFEAQSSKIKKIAQMFGDCMMNGGVVQLFGHKLNEEFVNELNYRAGGIVAFHAYRAKDAALKGVLAKELAGGEFLNDPKTLDVIESLYILDPRDMYCIISINGNEPFCIELAKRVKAAGKKLVVVTNLASYATHQGKLLDYADEYLDLGAGEPDVNIDINGKKYGQFGTTLGSVMAQEIMADLYAHFVEKGVEAPVLLSANLAGSDVYNHGLEEKYGGKRIH